MATAGITLLAVDLLARFVADTTSADQPDIAIQGVGKARPKLVANRLTGAVHAANDTRL